MKQTAVEWLFVQMGNVAAGYETELDQGQMLEKAKEMEKKQKIEFAKLHVETALKDIEEKLFEALDDREYLEENVCDVIKEMRNYKLENIK